MSDLNLSDLNLDLNLVDKPLVVLNGSTFDLGGIVALAVVMARRTTIKGLATFRATRSGTTRERTSTSSLAPDEWMCFSPTTRQRASSSTATAADATGRATLSDLTTLYAEFDHGSASSGTTTPESTRRSMACLASDSTRSECRGTWSRLKYRHAVGNTRSSAVAATRVGRSEQTVFTFPAP